MTFDNCWTALVMMMMRIRREFRDGLVPVKPLGARAGPVSTRSVETPCSLCLRVSCGVLWSLHYTRRYIWDRRWWGWRCRWRRNRESEQANWNSEWNRALVISPLASWLFWPSPDYPTASHKSNLAVTNLSITIIVAFNINYHVN